MRATQQQLFVALFLIGTAVFMFNGCKSPSVTAVDHLRLNQIQVVGTHNSYHLRPHDSLMTLIDQMQPGTSRGADNSKAPVTVQLSGQGMRKIELDCYADPAGGLFAKPLGIERAVRAGLPPAPPHDPEGKLKHPGFKVLHSPDIDFGTTVLTLKDGLREIRDWSLKHPRHVPIFIMIECKEDGPAENATPTIPFNQEIFASLETEIDSVFPREFMLTPDDVRGNAKTLPEALRAHGWPTLDSMRGRVLFGMLNEDAIRDRYLEGHPALENRLMFVSVTPENPAAAWMKRNDPVGGFDEIQKLVTAGFLVRTRADADTVEARSNDTLRRERAFASGAQIVSTDYPVPDPRFSNYHVRLPDNAVARVNPVNGPPTTHGTEIEE